ncbi:MAG: glycoside hydrolase family 9 protein [Lachnospiraceae bacterium]|jgi:endoglucanase|nr:glycoside hydrolase family 9 protein [Lachnospiraceae bacterium]
MKRVHLNQLGYRPQDIKKAAVTVDTAVFTVIRVDDDVIDINDGKVVLQGELSEPIWDSASGDMVRSADFTIIKEKGKYVVCAIDYSFPFIISDTPYRDLRRALLDFFPYQSCGVVVEADKWSHPACHTSLATIYGIHEKKDVSGGWHDAGDYGRYTVPAAMTVADLLLAHELAVSAIDEDLLDIVWFELEWLLKMQDETGGVYHKVTCHDFNALDEMPHDEHEELIIIPPTAAATADFAAVVALASRFYPEEKERLLRVAVRAWEWCVANPQAPAYKNPPDIRTGPYGDHFRRDEFSVSKRFWAACELYNATKDEKYHDYIKELWKPLSENENLTGGFGWFDMSGYGMWAYLYSQMQKNKDIEKLMSDRFLAECEEILRLYESDGYGVSLAADYRWGSNMIVANNAQKLLMGGILFPERASTYREAALAHFHYLLGHNPLSQSYITGFGAKPPLFPHHRPSVAVGAAMPGMVVGGPNMFTEADSDLHAACKGLPPSKCYVDHSGSYSANEVTIYWNSPVYFMAAVLGF